MCALTQVYNHGLYLSIKLDLWCSYMRKPEPVFHKGAFCVLESIEIDVCLMGYIWRLYLHLVGYLDLQYYSLDAKLQSGAGHRWSRDVVVLRMCMCVHLCDLFYVWWGEGMCMWVLCFVYMCEWHVWSFAPMCQAPILTHSVAFIQAHIL